LGGLVPEWETERLETIKVDDRRILTIHRISARGRSTGMMPEERHSQLLLSAMGGSSARTTSRVRSRVSASVCERNGWVSSEI
jgi:hypothetical protein